MNINTTTFDELRTLANVGQSRARYIIKKRDECNGCLSMETLLDISQIPNSVWKEYEGKFYFGESDVQEASDDEDGPTNTTTNMEKDIRGDLSNLFHCMEKLQMTVGGINDKLENLADRVEALEQKKPHQCFTSDSSIYLGAQQRICGQECLPPIQRKSYAWRSFTRKGRKGQKCITKLWPTGFQITNF